MVRADTAIQPAPHATYRLQLEPRFTFHDAARVSGYLAALGISHAYLSPCFEANPGSTHGYDGVDPDRVRAELGGEDGFSALLDSFASRGLGVLLDIVPNHQAARAASNPRWRDVLERGRSSPYAHFFDVDWQSATSGESGVVVLPILGSSYGSTLERGELVLERDGARFWFRLHGEELPVALPSLGGLLAHAARIGQSEALALVAEVVAAARPSTAPSAWSSATPPRSQPNVGVELARALLERELRDRPVARSALDRAIAEINADRYAIHRILEQQAYRLAFWRVVRRICSYRRFFDVDGLVGVRVEDETVFHATHARVLHWLERGRIAGVRIDHIDGLRDPARYLARLRAAAPDAWILVEKILAPEERLPSAWPVDGTTGYELARLTGGVLVDPDGEPALTELWGELGGEARDWHSTMVEAKRLVARTSLGGDLARLTALLASVCRRSWYHRDDAPDELAETLVELGARLPVYRTYVTVGSPGVPDGSTSSRGGGDAPLLTRSPNDEVWLAHARVLTMRARPDLDPALVELVAGTLSGSGPVRGQDATELALRFQQWTGPLAAKGCEDTALYRHLRLVALNEVGGDPGRFGTSDRELHAVGRENARAWPYALVATTTHDTKRSEDVRARLFVLSEIAEEWASTVRAWRVANASHWSGPEPDPAAEYLLYQTLVGAWPISAERAVAYMTKAMREAKRRTSWTDPDPAYESALARFVSAVLEDERFVADLERWVAKVLEPGRVNSLGQTLLKLTVPGVPDLYQGSELWDLRLVDPDNREPVDFELRARLLSELAGLSVEQVMERMDEGLPKLWLIQRTLAFRAAHRRLFDEQGSYVPIEAAGERARHVVAFARGEGAITVVPRWRVRLRGTFGDTALTLPHGAWRNVLTDERHAAGPVPIDTLLARFPVALLAQLDDRSESAVPA